MNTFASKDYCIKPSLAFLYPTFWRIFKLLNPLTLFVEIGMFLTLYMKILLWQETCYKHTNTKNMNKTRIERNKLEMLVKPHFRALLSVSGLCKTSLIAQNRNLVGNFTPKFSPWNAWSGSMNMEEFSHVACNVFVINRSHCFFFLFLV